MSMNEGQMHVVSIVGAVAIFAALSVPTLWLTNAADAHQPELRDVTVIEASIAVRKQKVVQPQKQVRTPDAPVKPTGVNHDDKKDPPVDPKKPDEKSQHDDKPNTDINRFQHGDPDDPAGKPVTTVGDFNGSEKGFGDVTKGDPWLGQLNADLRFTPPEIAKGDSVPVGCIHLTADGKIVDTKFDVKTDDDLQTAAEAALDGLKKLRNDHPVPVPDHLLPLTTKWLCFKFSVTK